MIDWIIKQAIFSCVRSLNGLQQIFVRTEDLYKILLIPGVEKARWKVGAWRAWYNAERTYRTVPAYRQYINTKIGGWPAIKLTGGLPDLSVLPETDKESYVKPYGYEARCVGGILPRYGVVVDESSGSSGTPTSWVRGRQEREVSRQLLQLSYHTIFKKESVFVINAFALGAWATGMNVSMSLSDVAIIKSTGPDIDKIITTMQQFGPKYHYLITGYPPFLKTLADDSRLEWSKFTVDAVYGGEGLSESMRDYLLKTYRTVIGSYGASDLEINMATENDFTVRLRKLVIANEQLRERITYTDWGVTPMIFQYNPLAYYLETNEAAELVCTLSRPTNIAPKIRYNIHDRGHVIRYPELVEILEELGLADEFADIPQRLELPVLLHYGRSDMSIDYYGANVTPDGVREVLFAIPDIAAAIQSFRLISYEDKDHTKRMRIAIELNKGATLAYSEQQLQDMILPRIADINRDFYNALYRTATKDQYPEITVHDYATGPFAGGDRKLKKEYVTTRLKYDSF